MKRGTAFEDKVNLFLTSGSTLEDVTFDLKPEETEAALEASKIIKDIYRTKLCDKVYSQEDFKLQYKLVTDDKIGYLDYYSPKHIIDLKTTDKTLKYLKPMNMRQMAFYRSFYDKYDKDFVPHLTLFQVVLLKKEIRFIIWSTCGKVLEKLVNKVYGVNIITEEQINKARLQNENAIRALKILQRNRDYINAIPVNADHYMMQGFDDGVVDRMLVGDLPVKTYSSV